MAKEEIVAALTTYVDARLGHIVLGFRANLPFYFRIQNFGQRTRLAGCDFLEQVEDEVRLELEGHSSGLLQATGIEDSLAGFCSVQCEEQ